MFTKVAIITGASQGIGAGAVQAYRKLGYAVVANSRHITSSADPGVLTVPGDIAAPGTGARLVDRVETAEFVTGEILHVDGGQSAGH